METLVAGLRGRPYSGQARDAKKVPGPKKLIFDFSKGFLDRAMIKFEADPVVGRAKGSARGWGNDTPSINKVAPKSPQRRVLSFSLLRFLRYLNRLAVDPMRRS